jgi:hypothetical protein
MWWNKGGISGELIGDSDGWRMTASDTHVVQNLVNLSTPPNDQIYI